MTKHREKIYSLYRALQRVPYHFTYGIHTFRIVFTLMDGQSQVVLLAFITTYYPALILVLFNQSFMLKNTE